MEHGRTNTLVPVLLARCVIIVISFGIRSAFGVFQIPIAEEFGWARSDFSMAIAIQNLMWGIGQPIFGALAEKYGDRKAIVLGIAVYMAGLFLSSMATTPSEHQLLEVLVGFGIAGTGMGIILAVVGRAATDSQRSMALAIATAMGSIGQVLGPPIAEAMLSVMPWQQVFVWFAVSLVAGLLVIPFLRSSRVDKADMDERLGQVLGRALRDPSYTLIFLGFFSCGYQLSFVTAHFPAFVTEMCGPIAPGSILDSMGISTTSALGAVAISLVGLANIVGTLLAGWAGNHWRKKDLLAGIYFARALISLAFILMPITPGTVILFSVAMGSLWLASVPLTAGLVGYIYGLRYMGTLYGLVFLSHQLGSFLGVWLGANSTMSPATMCWFGGLVLGSASSPRWSIFPFAKHRWQIVALTDCGRPKG